MRVFISSTLAAGLIAFAAPAFAQTSRPNLLDRPSSAILSPELVSTHYHRRHHCDGTHNGNCRLYRHNF